MLTDFVDHQAQPGEGNQHVMQTSKPAQLHYDKLHSSVFVHAKCTHF